jgi:predicted nucleic acid-binding protein
MAGIAAVFDSDIVIDFLNGVEDARTELLRYTDAYISCITWVETQVKVPAPLADDVLAAINSNFKVIPIDQPVLADALALRRQHKIKLPDALIWASARTKQLTLVTRNSKDFSEKLPGIRIPYRLDTKQ